MREVIGRQLANKMMFRERELTFVLKRASGYAARTEQITTRSAVPRLRMNELRMGSPNVSHDTTLLKLSNEKPVLVIESVACGLNAAIKSQHNGSAKITAITARTIL
jgi:hypothetical protein